MSATAQSLAARPIPVATANIGTSARSFEEYRSVFDLAEVDLGKRILDCPGGAAGLVAGIAAAGGEALAVDPLYALPMGALREKVRRDVEELCADTDRRGDEFDFEALGGRQVRERLRSDTLSSFLTDVELHPERYQAAALPDLPFADRSFDLALTSHLLFAYADVLSVEDHVAALVELSRVAEEVRVYPLVDADGTPLPELVRSVIARLKKARLSCRIEPVTRPFQRAATTRLVIEPMRRPEWLDAKQGVGSTLGR